MKNPYIEDLFGNLKVYLTTHKYIILMLMVVFLMGFGIGYAYGAAEILKMAIKVAAKLVNVQIDTYAFNEIVKHFPEINSILENL